MTGETPLWRQVNPNWVREGRVSSQAFRPTRKDANRLSVDNGDMVSAEEAYRGFAERQRSDGVLAVTAAECEAQELRVSSDPIQGRESHSVIDFSGLSRGSVRKAAERLRDAAHERGWQYRPPGMPEPLSPT